MEVLIAVACMLAFGVGLRFTIFKRIVEREGRRREMIERLERTARAWEWLARRATRRMRRLGKQVEDARWDDLFEGSLDFPRRPPMVSVSELDRRESVRGPE